MLIKKFIPKKHISYELYNKFSILLDILSRNLRILNDADSEGVQFISNPIEINNPVEEPGVFRKIAEDIIHYILEILTQEIKSKILSQYLLILSSNKSLALSIVKIFEMLNFKEKTTFKDLEIQELILQLLLTNFGNKSSDSIESFLMRIEDGFERNESDQSFQDDYFSLSFLLSNIKIKLFNQFIDYKIKMTQSETENLEDCCKEVKKYPRSGSFQMDLDTSEIELLDSQNEDPNVPEDLIDSPMMTPSINSAKKKLIVSLEKFKKRPKKFEKPNLMKSKFSEYSTDIANIFESFFKLPELLENQIFSKLSNCFKLWIQIWNQLILKGENLEYITKHVSLLYFVLAFDLHEKYQSYRQILNKRSKVFEMKNSKLELKIQSFDIKDMNWFEFIKYSTNFKDEVDKQAEKSEEPQFTSKYEKKILNCTRLLAISNFNLFRDSIVIILRAHFNPLLKFYEKIGMQNLGENGQGLSDNGMFKKKSRRKTFFSFSKNRKKNRRKRRYSEQINLSDKISHLNLFQNDDSVLSRNLKKLSNEKASVDDSGMKSIDTILKQNNNGLEEASIFLKNKNIIGYLDSYIKIMGVSKVSMNKELLKFFVSVKNLCGLKFLFILIRSKGKIKYINKSKKEKISKRSFRANKKQKMTKRKENQAKKESKFGFCNFFSLWKLETNEDSLSENYDDKLKRKKSKKLYSIISPSKRKTSKIYTAHSANNQMKKDSLKIIKLQHQSRFSEMDTNINNFDFSDDEDRMQKFQPIFNFQMNENVKKIIF